jgi:hypothetical protein
MVNYTYGLHMDIVEKAIFPTYLSRFQRCSTMQAIISAIKIILGKHRSEFSLTHFRFLGTKLRNNVSKDELNRESEKTLGFYKNVVTMFSSLPAEFPFIPLPE